jgi:pteridine reductase
MDLQGKVALVTGGAKRVGRAIAVKLAEHGCDVAFTYFTSKNEAAELAGIIGKLGRKAVPIAIDLNDPHAATKIRKQLLAAKQQLDVLVHNASLFAPTPWGRVHRDAWHEMLRVNVTAPVMITQEFTDLLAAGEGGRVIHMVDMHVMGRPRPGYAAYAASKAALLEMTRCLAVELAPKVTVNAVAPGVVAWADGMTQAEQTQYLRHVPLQRAGTPDDAAAAVLYLARDADYLTGEVIRVDGGRWLC